MVNFNQYEETVEMVFRNLDNLPIDELMKLFGSEGASKVMAVNSAIMEDEICGYYNIKPEVYREDIMYWNISYEEDKYREEV